METKPALPSSSSPYFQPHPKKETRKEKFGLACRSDINQLIEYAKKKSKEVFWIVQIQKRLGYVGKLKENIRENKHA
jgi:hypothetical protein